MIRTVLGDITKIQGMDAIVNAANKTLLGGSGVDGAIHAAAGPELLKECKLLDGCKTGQVKMTGAYDLPCQYIIHAVGPIWHGGNNDESALLFSCYYKALELASDNQIKKIAFPSISTGVYRFPIHLAAEIAVKAVKTYMNEHQGDIKEVVFVLFDSHTKYVYDQALKAANEASMGDLLAKYGDDDTVKIGQDKDEINEFFSNSYPANFIVDGLSYGSVSEYLKAERADELFDLNAYDALLLKANYAKYAQNPALRGKLLATKELPLFSGDGRDNALGRCLAELRDKFRNEYIEPIVPELKEDKMAELEAELMDETPIRLTIEESMLSLYAKKQLKENTSYEYVDELENLDSEAEATLRETIGIDAYGEIKGFLS